MNKVNHKEVISEIKKLRKILSEDSQVATPVATSVKSHLESLGYETKSTMAEVGDLTPQFGDVLKKAASALKQELPHLKIKFGSGRDRFHKNYPNSRHNKGNANDVVIKGIGKNDKEELDKISTVLCAVRKEYPGFTFIDEYRRPSRFSTGVHYHLSWSESGKDEGGGTSEFCSSLKDLDLNNINFDNIETQTAVKEPSKLDKFLDYVGLGDLSDAKAGDKTSQKTLVDKAKELFSDDDVKDTDDGFEIFGYKLDDVLSNVKDVIPFFESEMRYKMNLVETNTNILRNFRTDLENGPIYHSKRALGNWQSDNAWDLMAPAGTEWNSLTKGKVKKVRDTGRSTGKIYGTQVSIEGTDGYPDIFYTHLKNVTVKPGDIVDIGTPIGEISEWGESKSTHVHVGLPRGNRLKDILSSDYSEAKGKKGFFGLGKNTEIEKSVKEPNKLEKFLDSIGLGDFTDAEAGDKESQKKITDKAKKLFSDDDVKDTDDGFEIFGYKLDDVLNKVKDVLPFFEQQENKKRILEDIENIKSKMIK